MTTNINNGLITKIWGPGAWEFLHSVTFGYPVSPTDEQKQYYKDLCGVWDTAIVKGDIGDFSWGKANVVINGSVVIDLGEDKPFFFAVGYSKPHMPFNARQAL